jgi:hypothetical protein
LRGKPVLNHSTRESPSYSIVGQVQLSDFREACGQPLGQWPSHHAPIHVQLPQMFELAQCLGQPAIQVHVRDVEVGHNAVVDATTAFPTACSMIKYDTV